MKPDDLTLRPSWQMLRHTRS